MRCFRNGTPKWLIAAAIFFRVQSVNADAASFREALYRFPGQKAQLFLVGNTRPYFISSDCRKPTGIFDCVAFAAFSGRLHISASSKGSRKQRGGGADAGVALCSGLSGLLLRGFDARRNQNLFCAFADGSMISVGALATGLK